MASSATSKARPRAAAPRSRPPGRRERPKRFGKTEPRVFTPPLRPLEPRSPVTEKRTLGYDVIDFALAVLGIELYPWQQWLLVHMLELLPDGTLRFRTVVVLVARQNGKSTLSQVLALWFMIVWGWPLVLGTAQDLDVAEEIWQGAVDMVEDDPELAELVKRVVRVNGKKALELTSDGTKVTSKYKVKAASRRAGRGLTGNLIMLDELREHQTWDAWGAITKTTMAQAEALVLALSNAGDAASIVLRYLRKMGHQAIGDPDGICANDDPSTLLPSAAELEEDDDLDFEVDEFEQDEDTLGLFEWSAPPGCDIWDRDGWAWGNPSLNWNPGFTERTIASAAKTDPEWVFRTEVLCQWSDGALEGPFPPGTWDAGVDRTSQIPVGTAYAMCFDVSWDRTFTHVGVAGFRPDGLLHVEVIASRAGTDWLVPWLKGTPEGSSIERRHDPALLAATWQAKGAPVSSLGPALTEVLGDKAHEWVGSDLGPATGAFYDLVRGSSEPDDVDDELGAPAGQPRTLLAHRPQPILDVAAATAHVKPISDAYVWDRKNSPLDAAPLVAVTGAAWVAQHPPEPEEQPQPVLVFGM